MSTFTKEQMTALYEAEIHFESVKHGYIKSAPRWLTDQVADIYEDATGSKTNRNWNCSQCVADFYRKVGKLYFADKEEMTRQDLGNDFSNDFATGGTTIYNVSIEEGEEFPPKQMEEQVTEQPIKKGRGRKKKVDNE